MSGMNADDLRQHGVKVMLKQICSELEVLTPDSVAVAVS